MRTGRTFLTAAIAVAVLLAATATATAEPQATASGKLPLLIANCLKPKFEPRDVIFACGDASFGIRNVTWSTWSQKTALGSGVGEVNDCNPSCVQGQTKNGPMDIRLNKPRTCRNGRRLFTQLTFTWTAQAPSGPSTGTIPHGCKLLEL